MKISVKHKILIILVIIKFISPSSYSYSSYL